MDDILNLAFSIHRNPGVYALLLGSGISRSVGIPTGWEITLDLIEQVKAAGGEEFPEDTRYDELLEILGKTQNERNAIIRGYIEPTDQERENDLKVPSRAHRAIAKLIKDGYIKVVLTTNFDRLLEMALQEVGVTPDVISSDDMLEGTTPIRHSKFTVIKLHGDYRDVRTLNTSEELSGYSQPKNDLLDDIFDEYGLIICGWSARYDTALRDSIHRVKSRRYSAYWIEPNVLSQEANDLINHRKATLIPSTADTLFVELQGKVEALAKINREHPLTVAVAVERVKKLMVREETRIELEDLIRDEAEVAYHIFTNLEIEPLTSDSSEEMNKAYRDILSRYFGAVETSLNMVTVLTFYGKGDQIALLTSILSRWASAATRKQEADTSQKLPALFLLYAASMAAVHREKWDYLHTILIEPTISYFSSAKSYALLDVVNKQSIFDYNIYRPLSSDFHSTHIKEILRPIFQTYVPSDRQYDRLFDLFEMLLALISLHNKFGWVSHNAALPKYSDFGEYGHIIEFWIKGGLSGTKWGFLTEFFGGEVSKLEEALEAYRERATKAHSGYLRFDIPDYRREYKSSFP